MHVSTHITSQLDKSSLFNVYVLINLVLYNNCMIPIIDYEFI